MEQGQEQQLHELDVFLSHVADRLLSLLPPDSPKDSPQNPKPLLSLAFLSKLLDALLDVDAEFRPLLLLLVRGATPATAAPTSRAIADLLDRPHSRLQDHFSDLDDSGCLHMEISRLAIPVGHLDPAAGGSVHLAAGHRRRRRRFSSWPSRSSTGDGVHRARGVLRFLQWPDAAAVNAIKSRFEALFGTPSDRNILTSILKSSAALRSKIGELVLGLFLWVLVSEFVFSCFNFSFCVIFLIPNNMKVMTLIR